MIEPIMGPTIGVANNAIRKPQLNPNTSIIIGYFALVAFWSLTIPLR